MSEQEERAEQLGFDLPAMNEPEAGQSYVLDMDHVNVFRMSDLPNKQRDLVHRHKLWLDSLVKEYPLPSTPYKIGVYIRYYNQTKYSNYLSYHKKQFRDTIALCPLWTLIDFYVDNGIAAPNMENAHDWCRLLNDCFSGKVDLIITQKVSNVSRRPDMISMTARILAAQKHPVGIYFISENLFTLSSYYIYDLHETDFLPDGWQIPPDDEDEALMLPGGSEDESVSE